jgi:hypothetical protein
MNGRLLALFVVGVASFFTCGIASALPPTSEVSPYENERNEKALMKYLWPAIKSSKTPVRIYYNAICEQTALIPDDREDPERIELLPSHRKIEPEYDVILPRFEMQPPPAGETGLSAVRAIFRKDRRVRVTQDAAGIVRIRLGRVPEAIVRTRIASLTIDPDDQFVDQLWIIAIVSNDDVRVSMHRLGLSIPVKFSEIASPEAAPGTPPITFKNVTLDQALDIVAAKFGNVVLYGICTKRHLFDINAMGGAGFDEDWPNSPDGNP